MGWLYLLLPDSARSSGRCDARIGAAGIATLGIVWYGEDAKPLRLLSSTLVVLGVAGSRLFG